jgi:hypothetical protein
MYNGCRKTGLTKWGSDDESEPHFVIKGLNENNVKKWLTDRKKSFIVISNKTDKKSRNKV